MDIIMGVLRVWHINKFWNSFLMKILLMKHTHEICHWYYCRHLGRNLLRRITSMPVSFSNLIWSSLNLLKSTKLIDFWRSHLVVNGIVLSGEGICHRFSRVLGGIGSTQLQARALTLGSFLRRSLEMGPGTPCQGPMGNAPWLLKQISVCKQGHDMSSQTQTTWADLSFP